MNGKEEKQKMSWIIPRSETKTLEMNLLNYKEDKETTGKELDAVLTYLDKLKPQCETKVRLCSPCTASLDRVPPRPRKSLDSQNLAIPLRLDVKT